MHSNWDIIILIICAAIMLTGWLTGRHLPNSDKSLHFKKFQAVAAIIFLICFVFENPYVRSISFLSDKEYVYPRALETIRAVARQTQEQHQRLESLEIEVKDLRKELDETHRHYSFLLILLFSGTIGFIINSAFYSKR